MHHCKYKIGFAPVDAEIESGELFTYEHDYENNGICLITYSKEVAKPMIVIPDDIQGLPVVGVDASCFGVDFTDVYYPKSLKYFKWGGEKVPKIEDAYTIPHGIEKINSETFINCISLKSVTIPESVTNIDHHAFFYCSSLVSINVDKNNPVYSDIDGLLFSKDKTILN